MTEVELEAPLISGDIVLDGYIYRNGEKVALLTGREAQLLRILLRAANRPILLEDIQSVMYGGGYDLANLRMQMLELRRKVESDPSDPQLLRTARGGWKTGGAYMLVTDKKLAELLDRNYDGYGRRRKER